MASSSCDVARPKRKKKEQTAFREAIIQRKGDTIIYFKAKKYGLWHPLFGVNSTWYALVFTHTSRILPEIDKEI